MIYHFNIRKIEISSFFNHNYLITFNMKDKTEEILSEATAIHKRIDLGTNTPEQQEADIKRAEELMNIALKEIANLTKTI